MSLGCFLANPIRLHKSNSATKKRTWHLKIKMTSLILLKMEMNYDSSILATPNKGKNFPYLHNERFPD